MTQRKLLRLVKQGTQINDINTDDIDFDAEIAKIEAYANSAELATV